MKLVVTVGIPGSGKDELVTVAQNMGLATLKMGDLVRDETRRRGLPLNIANVARVASEEREKHGAGIWAQRSLPKLTETRMLVDGCRSDTEVTVYRHHFGDLFVLGIYCSPETRYERMRSRSRTDDWREPPGFLRTRPARAQVGDRQRVRARGRDAPERRTPRRLPPERPDRARTDPRSRGLADYGNGRELRLPSRRRARTPSNRSRSTTTATRPRP